MRIPAVVGPAILLATLLGGCSQDGGDDAQGVEAPTAGPGLPEDYARMKQAAALFAQEEYGEPPVGVTEDWRTGETLLLYDVVNCLEPFESAEIEELDPRTFQQEALARRVARHEHYLSQFLPAEAYRDALDRFEADSLRHIDAMPAPPDPESFDDKAWSAPDPWAEEISRLEQALAADIDRERMRLAPGAPAVRAVGECGAGEVPFAIATSPANGTVWLSTKFAFDLCAIRGRDPWDRDDCRWTEIGSAQETHYLSGRYVYQARWPDGRERRGVRRFDGNDLVSETVRVTIAAQ